MSLLAELKRRNVLRAAALYAAGAWLLVQVATQVFPLFHVAEWVMRWIVLASLSGFPFALAFSWLYEWTPRGFQFEGEISPNESITRHTGRKLDRWIIAVLLLAVVLLLTNQFVLHKDASSGLNKTYPGHSAQQNSVAVLAFDNLSGEKDNEYFSDGISEELLTVLQKIPGLHVSARTSAFSFKDKKATAQEIGEKLGVANLVEGSVRKAGNTVRIAARLSRAATGEQLWSESYSRNLKDVFAVESELAQTIVGQLGRCCGFACPISWNHSE